MKRNLLKFKKCKIYPILKRDFNVVKKFNSAQRYDLNIYLSRGIPLFFCKKLLPADEQ